MESLGGEFAHHHIRVNAIAPGAIRTFTTIANAVRITARMSIRRHGTDEAAEV
jgi:NAD(P)-dependent dehydrogenase (short-subunit alcohol dehydrogenase family)